MTTAITIGIVSPGAMGSALGRCWAAGGARVVATTVGRSPRTAGLAVGLELLPTLADVVSAADLVVSVVPPEAAVRTALSVAAAAKATGASPLVADLNAISPQTVAEVQDALAGCELVDGSISGPPPGGGAVPTVYLSGPRAEWLAGVAMPGVELRVVGLTLVTASAVKMCTASIYKGFTGLLTQALQTAEHHQVTEVVLQDLAQSYPELADSARVARQLARAASKSDRFPGEMRQIAQTQASAGAVGVLFEAMAAVYEAVNQTPLADYTAETANSAEDLTAVLAELARKN